MTLQAQRLSTIDDLRALEALPENEDKLFELIRGVIYEVVRPKPKHNAIVINISSPMHVFVKINDLGHVFGDGNIYELSEYDQPVPDASFVSKARQSTLPDGNFTIAPDLAVEVMSPSNREREMLDKIEVYLQYGTRLVWVVYPETRVVDVWRHAEGDGMLLRKVDIDGVLDGEDVLPGFTLPVRDIFPA